MKSHFKSLIFGISLAILVNFILVTNSFTVGKLRLVASEICFVKAFLQTLVFSIIITVNQSFNEPDRALEPLKTRAVSLSVWTVIYSLSTGAMTLTAYIGVKMIPIPDFVVFGHTSPVFTLLFSACILKERLTPLKISLCFAVIAGVVLVVQPTFIFASYNNAKISANITENSLMVKPTAAEKSKDIYLGIAISLACAASAGLGNVASAKARGVPREFLMAGGGIGLFIIAIISHYSADQPLPPSGLFLASSSLKRCLITTGVATGSMVGGHLMVVATQNAPPVVVSVMRSTEILLALAADKLLFHDEQDEDVTKVALNVVGALVVVMAVSLMATAQQIQNKIDDWQAEDESTDTSEIEVMKVYESGSVSSSSGF